MSLLAPFPFPPHPALLHFSTRITGSAHKISRRHTYSAYGPWTPPQHFNPRLYDDGCPGDVERAGCAEKTCAGGLGSGVCGGPGGCGDCGTDGKPLSKGTGGSSGCGGVLGAGCGGCGGG